MCDPDRHAPTPVGALCVRCDRAVVEGDQGMLIPYASDPVTEVAYHLDCFLHTVVGVGGQ